MKYVYVLQSLSAPERYYVGLTNDLKERLARHNANEVPHTSKFSPWRVQTYFGFSDEGRAVAFERYLKTLPAERSPKSDSSCTAGSGQRWAKSSGASQD